MRTEVPAASASGTSTGGALPQQGGNPDSRSGSPPDPKPAPRVIDSKATTQKVLADRECRACGAPAATGHHLIPRSEGGDDVADNIIPVCGSGTTGCHGALHGNPYVVKGRNVGPSAPLPERRDAEWVRRRIGENLTPAELMYVGSKLGATQGHAYLARHYHLA